MSRGLVYSYKIAIFALASGMGAIGALSSRWLESVNRLHEYR